MFEWLTSIFALTQDGLLFFLMLGDHYIVTDLIVISKLLESQVLEYVTPT